jgi:four helix bundle protein
MAVIRWRCVSDCTPGNGAVGVKGSITKRGGRRKRGEEGRRPAKRQSGKTGKTGKAAKRQNRQSGKSGKAAKRQTGKAAKPAKRQSGEAERLIGSVTRSGMALPGGTMDRAGSERYRTGETMTDPYQFPFERLDVYRVAMELMGIVAKITEQLPKGNGDLRFHITRSARSIHLNIAEACGSRKAGVKANRYETARGSAAECASGLREVRMFGLAERRLINEADNRLHRLGLMLTRLIEYWIDAP